MSLWQYSLQQTPLCVFDIETSGFSKNSSEIIEVAIWRKEPKENWCCVLDSLIRAEKEIPNTRIHGIREQDLFGAPTFKEIAPLLLEKFSGSLIIAHNIYFDLPFLLKSFEQVGQFIPSPPYACSIYLRKMAGFEVPSKIKHSLEWAAQQHQITQNFQHSAKEDAFVVTRLINIYFRSLLFKQGVKNWEELGQGYSYQFLESWNASFWNFPKVQSDSSAFVLPRSG